MSKLTDSLTGAGTVGLTSRGALVDLLTTAEERESLKARAGALPSIRLSNRDVCDLELLATGAFSPLDRFMGESDYTAVIETMRRADGSVFPIPVTLAVDANPALHLDRDITLCNLRNEPLAVMTIEEIYEWDRERGIDRLVAAAGAAHAGAQEIQGRGRFHLSGPLRVLELPRRHGFNAFRRTPAETREMLEETGCPNIVAFATRRPIHRAEEALLEDTAARLDAAVLVQPIIDGSDLGDIDQFSRVRSHRILAAEWAGGPLVVALLPLIRRWTGVREILGKALLARNFGATHMILDPAETEARREGDPATGSLDLGVEVLPHREFVYLPDEDRYEDVSKVGRLTRIRSMSPAEVEEGYFDSGRRLPGWFTRSEVAEILEEAHPPKRRQGVCIWFTGLSGAGKSTTSDVLSALLMEHGRQTTVLDGDVVRTHLSKGLGFSKEDRDANVRRIGYVASEIVRYGGVAICAAVSPYRAAREDVRRMVGGDRFVEVFVNTPIEVCEHRDAKGMYAKARRGEITGFTGVDDPYEPPLDPEVTLDTTAASVEENARRIIDHLITRGYVRSEAAVAPMPAGPHRRGAMEWEL